MNNTGTDPDPNIPAQREPAQPIEPADPPVAPPPIHRSEPDEHRGNVEEFEKKLR